MCPELTVLHKMQTGKRVFWLLILWLCCDPGLSQAEQPKWCRNGTQCDSNLALSCAIIGLFWRQQLPSSDA